MATATTDALAVPLHVDEAAPAPERRPRVLLIGTAFAAAGSAAAIGTVLAVYLSVRRQVLDQGDTWLPDGAQIPLSPGNMGAVTLLMSVVFVQWAVHSGATRDRPHAYLALGTTILFGLAHITQIGFLWTEWGVELNVAEGTPQTSAVLLFTIIGLHVAMVVAGLIFLALMLVRSLGGQFTGRDAEGLSAAALYWWVTVGVYLVLWYAVLVTK